MSSQAFNQINDMNKALELTLAMLRLAKEGGWDQLQVMDVERRQLVEAWVEQDNPADDHRQATEIMSEMISLNKQIQQLAIAAKQQLMDDFKGLRRKRAGAEAYSKCP
ncbi:MAG: flagellar protein FliT [Sedimenticola sp.]